MGDVREGDELFDELGRPCRVMYATDVQLGRPCYVVRFDDGTEIVADADHRWVTWDHRYRKAQGRAVCPQSGPAIRTTVEIRATLMADHGRERNHSIPVARPLVLPDQALPIDPYALGVWLGDGSSATGEVTVHDDDAAEVLSALAGAGIAPSGPPRRQHGASCMTYPVGGKPFRRDAATGRMVENGSFHSQLRALGLLKNKHVPAPYLRGSIAQRTALLAGLLDTDGCVTRGGRVEFCSSKQTLSESVFELAASLGHKPTMAMGDATLYGRVVGKRWRVAWSARSQVFRLKRKAGLIREDRAQRNRATHRYIVAVEPTDSVPVRCITVDSPSHLYLAGRAMVPTHNTRTGAEWLHAEAMAGDERRYMAIIGKTPGDVRDVMVEGPSGVMAVAPPWERPEYIPSKRRLTWPTGATATVYSGANPEQTRGFGGDRAWCDELAAWRYPQETWDNLLFGMREAKLDAPKVCVTTTPKPMKLVKDILARCNTDPAWRVVTSSSYVNRYNLSPLFYDTVIAPLEGTTLGQQEIHAKILSDDPRALWHRETLDKNRVLQEPRLSRIVVGVDPAISATAKSDETGIVVAGVDGPVSLKQQGYVLDDQSGRYSPQEWGETAVRLYHRFKADAVVAEANQGGDMVEHTIRTIDPTVNVQKVHASQGKHKRFEPVAALDEQGRVHHVGMFGDLEDQMCTWIEGERMPSPDRADARAWALWELMLAHEADAPVVGVNFGGLVQSSPWRL
jgi:phage terminase large subunit-like protein